DSRYQSRRIKKGCNTRLQNMTYDFTRLRLIRLMLMVYFAQHCLDFRWLLRLEWRF
ncbi:hypothetical protein BJX70DRAFT_364559, partial [Aspergillus crustosus]